MLNRQKEIIGFFLRHPEYFLNALGYFYPFTEQQIRNYGSRIDWRFLSGNSKVAWNGHLIEQYKDIIDWESFSSSARAFSDTSLINKFSNYIEWDSPNRVEGATLASNPYVPWTLNLISKYESKLDFEQLSLNESLPWTEEIVDRFKERWSFDELLRNSSLPWSLAFFRKYFDAGVFENGRFSMRDGFHKSVEIVDAYADLVYWPSVCSNSSLPWVEKDLLKKWKMQISWQGIAGNNKLLALPGFFDEHVERWLEEAMKNFSSLSYNESAPWSLDLLERFDEFWDWSLLSLNPGLPWDEGFIERYFNKIQWGESEVFSPDSDPDSDYDVPFGTRIERVEPGLTGNPGVPWSIEILLRYEENLDFRNMDFNEGMWEKAFQPYLDDTVLRKVFHLL